MFLVGCHLIKMIVFTDPLPQNKAHQVVSLTPPHIDFAIIACFLQMMPYMFSCSQNLTHALWVHPLSLPSSLASPCCTASLPCSAFIHEASDPSQQVPLVDSSLQTPVGLALDWLQHNLYWTDSGDKSISVASVDGTKRRVLINTDLSEPRAIALDPHHG